MASVDSRVLYSDEYVTVTLDSRIGLVRYSRSPTPYPSLDVMREHSEKTSAAFRSVSTGNLGLLVDIRAAPPRNDDAFEAEVTRALSGLVSRFRAHAFLVKSAVGKLQARRLATSRGDTPDSVFSDEAEALSHLGVGG